MEFELNSKIDLLSVSIPTDDKDFKLLRVGDEVNAIIYDSLNLIGFEGTVFNRKYEDMPIYELTDIRNYSKIQRRQEVRVEYSITVKLSSDLKIYEIDDDNVFDLNKGKFVSSTILNLSAGGMKVVCDKDYDIGQKLTLHFFLGKDSYNLKGEVVYKEIKNTKIGFNYSYGIKFRNISEPVKDIFIQMRKNRMR